MLCAGTGAPGARPGTPPVTSQVYARKPVASISARISSGVRRKLVDASRAHITGKTSGCTGPAIGSWNARRPPGRNTR